MSALLDRLLASRSAVAVQTDWKSDVVETRDKGVITDPNLYQSSPATHSKSAQTDSSALRTKSKSVATDPEITGTNTYFFTSHTNSIEIKRINNLRLNNANKKLTNYMLIINYSNKNYKINTLLRTTV